MSFGTILIDLDKRDEKLDRFLEKIGATFVYQSDYDGEAAIDTILFSGEENFFEILSTFNSEEKTIKLISYGAFLDLSLFINNNGVLILDDAQFENPIYQKGISYLFEKTSSLNLNSLFQNSFNEFHQFSISTHSSVGQLTDQAARIISSKNFNPALVRSYLDHLILYFAYLEKENLGSSPFEVEFGFNDDGFCILGFMKVKDFDIYYVEKSLNKIGSSNNVEYLLTILYSLAHSLDIIYDKVSETLSIRSYFPKMDNYKASSSFSFYISENTFNSNEVEAVCNETDLRAIPEEVTLHGGFSVESKDVEIQTTELDFNYEVVQDKALNIHEEAQTISGSKPSDSFSQKISGGASDEEVHNQAISGENESDEDKQRISSKSNEEDEYKKILSSISENEKKTVHLFGKKIEEDSEIARLSRSITENLKEESLNLSNRTFGTETDKDLDLKIKKMELEKEQMESLFRREIEKILKEMSNKDLLLQKTKESVTNLVNKKNEELKNIQIRLDEANKKYTAANIGELDFKNKRLKSQNENLEKMIGIFKGKVSSLNEKLLETSKNREDKKSSREIQILENEKLKLEKVIEIERRKSQSLLKKNEQGIVQEKEHKEHIRTLEAQNKELLKEIRKVEQKFLDVEKANKSSAKKEAGEDVISDTNHAYKLKIKELEDTIKEIQRKSENEQRKTIAENNTASSKEKMAEANLKKVATELARSKALIAEEKKASFKLKADNTKLQNEVSALQKELAKLKGAKAA